MITFRSAAGEPRPVRLSEATRQFAYDSLTGKYGLELRESDHLTMPRAEADALAPYARQDKMLSRIAREAPVRIVPGERLAGSATLLAASRHVIPVLDEKDEPILGSMSHTTLGFERVLKQGVNAVDKQIRARMSDPLTEKQIVFLRSLLGVIDDLRVWRGRYLDALGAGPIRQALLRVPFEPAETFFEGVQSLWFTFAFTRLMGNWPGIGRIDKMLEPLYQKDLARGAITEDDAREMLAHFFIKGCEWITLTSNGTGDGQHYQNLVLAGLDTDGRETAGTVTRLVLEVVEELPIGDFPIAVRVREDSPEWLLKLIARVMRHGSGVCSVYNESLVIDSLTRYHYPPSEAYNFANDGCWEVQIPGKTRFGYAPMDAFRILQDGVLHVHEGEIPDYPDFDSLFEAYLTALDEDMVRFHESADKYIDENAQPTSVFALFTEGCVENARDYLQGGPVYNVFSPHYGGIPDVANSLTAIRKLVYEDHTLTLPELIATLRGNWDGAEATRRKIAALAPHFGNGDPQADGLAKTIVQRFIRDARIVHLRRGTLRPPGISTFGRQIDWKDVRGASAQGARVGDILSSNLGPAPGTDTRGATAVIRSHCSAGLSDLTCGTALDIKLDPSCARGEEGVAGIESLILGFVKLGGFFMQIDVIDNEELLKAQAHPENYPTLAVRISGWSARFVTLDKEWQRMIIERTTQEQM